MGDTLPISLDVLSPELRRDLEASVEAGDFASVSEALRDAVNRWARERRERAEWKDRIRADVQRSLRDRRPDIEMDEVFDRLEAKILARIEAAGGDEAT